MHRSVVIAVALTALGAGVYLGWVDVSQEREFRRLIGVGDQAVAAGRPGDAIEAFSGATVLKPESMLAFLKRGDTYRRRGDVEAAVRDLTRATTLDPTAPQPIERLGDVYADMGQFDRAAEMYGRYLTLDDRAAPVFYKLGLAHYRAGRQREAAEPLRKAIALDGRLPEAHYVLGLAYRAVRDEDAALAALDKALEVDATFTPAREEMADLLADVGRRRDGIEQLEALAALEPGRPERLVSVGLAYSRLARHESAIATLNRAAERHPKSAQVQVALGEAWIAMGESGTGVDALAVRRARAVLEPLARRQDASGEALAFYGKALLLSGDAAAAERVLQEAITRPPVPSMALRALADAATRLGHTAIVREAQAALARF